MIFYNWISKFTFTKKNTKIFCYLINIFFWINFYPLNSKNLFSEIEISYKKNRNTIDHINPFSLYKISSIKWEKLYLKEEAPIWNKIGENEIPLYQNININEKETSPKINSLNRSIVFDDSTIGPDISWLVPPGLSWNKKYKFDMSTRGHNRREKGEAFLAWNDGDAVGQFYYHPIFFKNYSLGFNLGMRSVYSGSSSVAGGSSEIGDGLSLGFRLDKKLSNSSGVALGAEQLFHFSGITDTGRDLYLTVSKGWFGNDINNYFTGTVATFGFATGKMAEGNIKGLCSDLFGGSGTEAHHKRPLCWAPVFSLARVYNSKFSTFFEYNSKWFLLGSSLSPFDKVPLRGTFAIQLSDHIDNYQINSLDELKYVFRLSLGF